MDETEGECERIGLISALEIHPSVSCGTISTANTFTVEIVPQWTDGEIQQVFRIFGRGRLKIIVGLFFNISGHFLFRTE